MSDKEKNIEKNLVKKIEVLGGLCLKFWPITFTGFPDRFILMPGARFYLAETKTKGDKLSPRQRFVHKQLRALGFDPWILDTNEMLNEFIKHVEEAV